MLARWVRRLSQRRRNHSQPIVRAQWALVDRILGGEWGGKIDDAMLPQKYLIQCVRVYEKTPEK